MRNSTRSVVLAWFYVFIYLGIIFIGSSLPSTTPILGITRFFYLDKFLHVAEYAVLGFLLVRAIDQIKPESRALLIILFALGGFYAVTDEWHQSFVPGREVSALDLVADLIGLYCGAIFWKRRNLRGEDENADNKTV